MSDRSYHKKVTQGVQHVEYNVSFQSQGATGPTILEGDINGNRTGSYVAVARGFSGVAGVTGGQTGCYYVKTTDSFVAVVSKQISLGFSGTGQAGAYSVEFAPAVRQSDGTILVPFTTYASGVRTDVPSTGRMYVRLVLRNSNVTP